MQVSKAYGSYCTFVIDDSFCRYDYKSEDESVPVKPEEKKEDHRYMNNIEYYPNGTIKSEKIVNMHTKKAFGPFYEYYSNGSLYRKGYLFNNVIQNKLKIWYPSGVLASKEEFDDGFKNGTSIKFYESGAIASKMTYRLYVATNDGKLNKHISLLDGDYYEYFEDGRPKTHIIYNKGKIDTMILVTQLSTVIPSSNYSIII